MSPPCLSTDGRDGRTVLWFGWIAFVVSLLSFMILHDLRLYMNADYCYAPALLQDLLYMGGRLRDWDVPPAPYFFPDVFVYAAWYALFRNPCIALAVAGASFLTLFVGGWFLVARRLARGTSVATIAPCLILVAGATLCSFNCFLDVTVSTLLITGHFGVTAMAPFVVLMTLSILAPPPGQAPAKWLFFLLPVLLSLLVFSDMLAVVQVILPVAAASAAVALKPAPVRGRSVLLIAALGAGVLLGSVLLARIDRTASVAYLQFGFSAACAKAAAELGMEWIGQCVRERPLQVLPIGAAACLLLARAALWFRDAIRGRSPPAGSVVVPVFAVASVISTAAGVLFAGRWMEGYMSPLTVGLVFAAISTLSLIEFRGTSAQRVLLVLTAALGITVAINCAALLRIGEIRRYSDGRAPWVRRLETQLSRLGLRCGVTDYWLARPVTLFSSEGVVMLPSTPHLMPRDWISNRTWFDRYTPQFAYCAIRGDVPDRIPEQEVLARFGPPESRHVLGDMSVLVYRDAIEGNGPSVAPGPATRFGEWWKAHPSRVRFSNPGEVATYATAPFSRNGNNPFRAPECPVGARVLSMLRTFPAGEYALRFDYEATPGSGTASAGAWQAMRVVKEKADPIGGGMLWFGTNAASGSFILGSDSQVDLRILYSGAGVLSVRSMEVQRVR